MQCVVRLVAEQSGWGSGGDKRPVPKGTGWRGRLVLHRGILRSGGVEREPPGMRCEVNKVWGGDIGQPHH